MRVRGRAEAVGAARGTARQVVLKVGHRVWVQAYVLRRSRRARSLRLSLAVGGEVVLTLPWGCALEEGEAFMRERSLWLERVLSRAQGVPTLADFVGEQGWLAVGGQRLGVVAVPTRHRSYHAVDARRAEVLLGVGEGGWLGVLRGLAGEVLPVRVRTLAQSRSLRVGRVSVRNQGSRWGSCSLSGGVSLNWRLLLVAPELQDYVIWHELAHLREMNHSAKFWAYVQELDPQALAHDAALTRVGRRVMALGREAPTARP